MHIFISQILIPFFRDILSSLLPPSVLLQGSTNDKPCHLHIIELFLEESDHLAEEHARIPVELVAQGSQHGRRPAPLVDGIVMDPKSDRFVSWREIERVELLAYL